jgi:hypothetical protein
MINHDPEQLHRQLMKDLPQELGYTGGDVLSWQKTLKAKVWELLGMDQMPSARPELNVESLWKRDIPEGSIEKIIFTSERDYQVPAYLCLPVKPQFSSHEGKQPFFICLQGHSTGMHNSIAVAASDEITPIEVEGDRDFALECLRRGIPALCLEQRAFGECSDPTRPGCLNSVERALMLGRTLLGERVFDVDRAVDYLLTRPDTDPDRIGIMGNSGGGTVSLFAGALLSRITHVMPSCAFSTFRDSIMSIPHCSCNFVPHLLRYCEISDIAGLCAPRPLVIVSGKEDDIFPIEGAIRSFKVVKSIYKELGEEDRCCHITGKGGHRFYAEDSWPAMENYL